MYEQNIKLLKELNLAGMLEAYREQAGIPDIGRLSHDEWIGLLLERELSSRSTRRLERLLRGARFRFPDASLEKMVWKDRPGLERSVVLRLQNCEWVRAGQIVLISGKTGTGKTFLANTLGHTACEKGFSAYFAKITDLCRDLDLANVDGTYNKRRTRLAKVDVLILDDWGSSGPFTANERRHLYDILDDRYRRKATVVTSQFPISEWYSLIGEPTSADAIMDRLVHHAHRIELEGDSMRRRKEEADPSEPKAS